MDDAELFNRLCESYGTLGHKLHADGVENISAICRAISHRFGTDEQKALGQIEDLLVHGPRNEKNQRKAILKLLEVTFNVEFDLAAKEKVATKTKGVKVQKTERTSPANKSTGTVRAESISPPSDPFVELSKVRLGTNYWIDRFITATAPQERANDFLREAQRTAQYSIRDTFITKHPHRFLVDMPTQSGKTPLYIRLLQLLAETGPTPRALIIAPYRRLVDQLRKEFEKFGGAYPKGHPLSDIGVWHAFEKTLAQVTATTWHSAMIMVRDKIIDPKDYDVVFIDEAHLGQTEKRLGLMKLFKNAIIGDFTATPAYNEDKSLEKVSVLAYRMTPEEAVAKKVISPWREIILQEDLIDLSDVPLVGDDYDARVIERRISTEARTQGWIRFYRDWVDPVSGQAMFGKQGYINTVSIKRANELSERFNAELGSLLPPGIKATEAIHSDMSPAEQTNIFERYKQGKIKLLVQIRLAGLGLSHKEADLCINDAPSLSPVEVEQRGGRVVAIDPNNHDKCSFIVERPDFGRGTKQALMYGEVVGPGVGYKKIAAVFPSNHQLRGSTSNVLSDPKEVEAFVRARMKGRIQAIERANFSSVYPVLIEHAMMRGFKTVSQLWRLVAFKHSQHFPDAVRPEEEDFIKLIRGKNNPWDNRDLFKCYTPLAVALSAVVGVHVTKLFGTPDELSRRFVGNINADNTTAQRLHIRELMRRAWNPMTGKPGIEVKDIKGRDGQLGLAVAQAPYSHNFNRILDGGLGRGKPLFPFDKETGEATLLAIDFATILDLPVEEVFKYDAAHLCLPVLIDKADYPKAFFSGPLSLPLDHTVKLKVAKNIVDDQTDALAMETELFEKQLKVTIHDYLLRLSPKRERVIRLRFGINQTEAVSLRAIADQLGISGQTILNTEHKAIANFHQIDGVFRHDALIESVKTSLDENPIVDEKVLREKRAADELAEDLRNQSTWLSLLRSLNIYEEHGHVQIILPENLSEKESRYLSYLNSKISKAEGRKRSAIRRKPILEFLLAAAEDQNGERDIREMLQTIKIEEQDQRYCSYLGKVDIEMDNAQRKDYLARALFRNVELAESYPHRDVLISKIKQIEEYLEKYDPLGLIRAVGAGQLSETLQTEEGRPPPPSMDTSFEQGRGDMPQVDKDTLVIKPDSAPPVRRLRPLTAFRESLVA